MMIDFPWEVNGNFCTLSRLVMMTLRESKQRTEIGYRTKGYSNISTVYSIMLLYNDDSMQIKSNLIGNIGQIERPIWSGFDAKLLFIAFLACPGIEDRIKLCPISQT